MRARDYKRARSRERVEATTRQIVAAGRQRLLYGATGPSFTTENGGARLPVVLASSPSRRRSYSRIRAPPIGTYIRLYGSSVVSAKTGTRSTTPTCTITWPSNIRNARVG